MPIAGAVFQVLDERSYTLTRSAFWPPVTMMSPFGRFAIPGQNMSCLVLETVIGVTLPVLGSKMEDLVRPEPLPLTVYRLTLAKSFSVYADHVRICIVNTIECNRIH